MSTEKAYKKAVGVLEKCETDHGFHAAFPGYKGIWSRDSNIISIGASLLQNRYKKTFEKSLEILGKHQSKKGQIPNAVLLHEKPKKVDYKSIDSTMWFIIGNYLFRERYGDSSLLRKNKTKIKKALTWLSYQEVGETPMLEQLPTTDWQDAFPHRYGYTINTQALYYKVLNLVGKKKEALRLKKFVNSNKEDGLWNGSFYYPWRWKNHNKYHERGEWFDSLGNLLAVLFGLADSNRAEKILAHIKRKGVDKPFPVKTIYPPIKRGSKDWRDYFQDADSRTPYHYLNGGIWTFIGGFYVCALVKMKKFKEAEKQLRKLARANLQTPLFSEWLDGRTGKPVRLGKLSGNQGWNAGMYVAAYHSIVGKKSFV